MSECKLYIKKFTLPTEKDLFLQHNTNLPELKNVVPFKLNKNSNFSIYYFSESPHIEKDNILFYGEFGKIKMTRDIHLKIYPLVCISNTIRNINIYTDAVFDKNNHEVFLSHYETEPKCNCCNKEILAKSDIEQLYLLSDHVKTEIGIERALLAFFNLGRNLNRSIIYNE